eukprot:CAMPEP_0176031146 /NCGR_PEP_ID=MMETSP0120_2-20121206/15346_1 /TAXON_ID=160619 /ORGANISM="Kryptoperidinium foliaceum, Strain CCMP 1326" /LENGTH=149 /DNA_ID=CAMNT_0017364425 /DNA_START=33 /DNA_END=482 /DNA_ORIENTATION=-
MTDMKEEFCNLIEVRPGRHLFVRNWRLGDPGDDAQPQIRLLCIHGTAANHTQFLAFLEALHDRLNTGTGNSSLLLDAWMYDAVGCGQSPALQDAAAYRDEEQVQDMQALITQHIMLNSEAPLIMLGHSYGPNWIYKYLMQSNPLIQQKA